MRKIAYYLLSILLFVGCSTGIKPIKDARMNGSQSKIQRSPVKEFSNFTEVKVSNAVTNKVNLSITDNGIELLNLPVNVITPAEKKYVQIAAEIKIEQKKKWNWPLTIKWSIILLVVCIIVLYSMGLQKIEKFILSPFRSSETSKKKTITK